MASSIGVYSVVSMQPKPQGSATRLALESRPGVDGVGLWELGTGGEAEEITTVVNVATFAAAVALCALYRATIGAGPQAIVYGGQGLGNYHVLDVQAEPKAIVRSVGGVVPGGLAIVTAKWRIVAAS